MNNIQHKRRVFVLLIVLFFIFSLVPPLQAGPRWWWPQPQIKITIKPQKPDSFQGSDTEFLANPVYVQGEQATFSVAFRLAYPKWQRWFRFLRPTYIDIPKEFLYATFPDSGTKVKLTRIRRGHYIYTSPMLTEVGTGNHTLTVAVAYSSWRGYRRVVAQSHCSISVAKRPLNIEITSPLNGTILNRNPLSVSGTIDDNEAEITVNGVSAEVSDNQFKVEIPVEEGENIIRANAENEFGATDRDSITVTIDTIPPQNPSISIQEGNQTDEALIHLILYAEGADQMIISENPNFTGAVWEPYREQKGYTLSGGEGVKRIYVKFRDGAGNRTETLQTRILLGHIITITSPQNGLAINASWVTVTGTINGENIPVYVNGIPAKIVDNTFYINQFPLTVGANTITAQAYIDGELLEEATVNIAAEDLIDPVQITANPLSGEPDLEVNFTITTNLENPITNYAWDFDNDGQMDWQSPGTGNTIHTYNRVRLYHPTIRVTDTNQIQFATTVTINVHLPGQLEWSIDTEDPIDLAVDTERNFYILQRTPAQIRKYDKDGNYIDTFGGIGQALGQFTDPCGIALDQAGNIYIADTGNNRIQKLTPFGLPDETFGQGGVVGINADSDEDGILDSGTEPSQFNQPYGIAVDGEGSVYVTDTGNNRIQKFSLTGEFLLQWEAESPYGIAADLLGDLYIADRNNNQIQIFSSMGSYLGTYDTAELYSPTDTALSGDYFYIADTGNNRIQKINREYLTYVSSIGTFASGEEVDTLSSPVAVALDNDLQKELIYVADSGSNRVVKIELPTILPDETWNAMKQAVLSNGPEEALNYFSESSQSVYRKIFEVLEAGGGLIPMINGMEDIQLIIIQSDVAQYRIRRMENGEEFTYYIYFEKNENGEWKIVSF